ncbi:amidohydrolase family protein [Pendulispora albinea]|uniref:Amidohydrolase family protein n=1 Tax=Pendulispora albinea TaxID=2741071 RepID=A0ABZ2LNI9_9BACT
MRRGFSSAAGVLGVCALGAAGAACAGTEHAAAPGSVAAPGAVPASAPAAAASPKPAAVKHTPRETVSFRLYKFLNHVGGETDTYIAGDDGGTEAKAAFGFRDRGVLVPLAASYRLASDGTPRQYEVWGNTARNVRIDERLVAEAGGEYSLWKLDAMPARVQARAPFVVASGYAPMLGQDLMFRAWVRAGRPATMPLLPAGTVSIVSRGNETFGADATTPGAAKNASGAADANAPKNASGAADTNAPKNASGAADAKRPTLEHVSVRGLSWGREDAWLDEAGKLVAVVTHDAEFDPFQGVREDSVELLPKLVARAGADAAAWLDEVAKTALIPRGGAGGAGGTKGAELVALVGGQLVDGTGRPPVSDAVVVYDGETIVAAGPRASTPIPAGATSVDVTGKTVLPGLWDMHAHVTQIEQGAVYLGAGVTTVRDLGNVLEFITGVRDAIAAGKGLGPQIIVDGLVDGDGDRALGVIRIASKDDIVPVLDRLKRAGCPEVKIYSSIAPSLVKPIAAEAHRRGMRVVGHVPNGMNVVEALDAGFDGISHIDFLFGMLFGPNERRSLSQGAQLDRIVGSDVSSGPLQRAIRAFVAKKAFLDDTLALYELFTHSTEENARREPGIAKLPRELSEVAQGPADDALAERRARRFERMVTVLRELHRQGVPIVAGTDIGIPGHTLHRELELYVEAGFTPMEAIQAATSVPARLMHLDGHVGTVTPGKRADLVIVAGNPLSNIRDIRKISAVVARGRTYDPAALWRIAGFTP